MISPNPVVAVGAPLAAPNAQPAQPVQSAGALMATGKMEPPTRACARCNGVLDGGAAFCKFCGAPTAPTLASGAPANLAAPKRPSISVPPPAPAGPPVAAPPAPQPFQPPPAAQPVQQAAPQAAPAPSPVSAGSPRTAPSPEPDGEFTEKRSIPAGVPLGRIVVVSKDGGEGPDYSILDRVDIGRTEGEVRFPDDRYLSARHVRLTVRDRRLYLQDISTANGVYLRLGSGEDAQRPGFRPPSTDLADGQYFLIGQQVLRFERIENEGGYGPLREGDTLLFGTPAPVRYGRLAQRTVEGVTLDVHHLKKTETYLGRESGDLVFMDDPFLSRRHAKILYETESRRFRLIDLGSSNGTFYKLGPTEIELLHGDQFRIGQQLLRVELDARQRRGDRDRRPSEEGHRA